MHDPTASPAYPVAGPGIAIWLVGVMVLSIEGLGAEHLWGKRIRAIWELYINC